VWFGTDYVFLLKMLLFYENFEVLLLGYSFTAAPYSAKARGNYCSAQWSPIPGPRKNKMCTGGDTARLLGMWLVDTPATGVVQGRGRIVKR